MIKIGDFYRYFLLLVSDEGNSSLHFVCLSVLKLRKLVSTLQSIIYYQKPNFYFI